MSHSSIGTDPSFFKPHGATMRREIEESLQTLRRELGDAPRAFCFPWGKPGDTRPEAFTLIQQAGYYAAVTTSGGGSGGVARGLDRGPTLARW